jgi:hypothetical protein
MHPKERYKVIFWCFLTCFLLAACTPATPPPLTPDEFQTVTPLPTIDSFTGVSAIPDGLFLFIAVSGSQRCGAFCNCPAVEAVQDPFDFYDNKLDLNWSGSHPPSDQGWAELRAENQAIGLYSFYNLTESNLKTFTTLPYSTPDEQFIVTGVDENGAIAVKMGNDTSLIPPNERIQQQNTRLAGGLCTILFTTTLKNYGFISDEQVTVR